MPKNAISWTNQSVLAFSHGGDPISAMTTKARDVVLRAIEDGWSGPPFSPFELADHLRIQTTASEDVLDARTVSSTPDDVQIEFNPQIARDRLRFSLAHEISHTFFADFHERVRFRSAAHNFQSDDWQLELLCNIGAAELLMPVGSFPELSGEAMTIENVISVHKRFQASVEAVLLRMIKLTTEPCAAFAASRVGELNTPPSYKIDYLIPSRSFNAPKPDGFSTPQDTVLNQCTAIGFTAKGREQWGVQSPAVAVECVGIAAYPGHSYPRVVGILRQVNAAGQDLPKITYLRGDATAPRGSGPRILVHIANDQSSSWGAGFGLAVRRKWPQAWDDFRAWASATDDNLTLGNFHITNLEPTLAIAHIVAQHGLGPSRRPRVRYTPLRDCLAGIATVALQRGATIHMPKIGTGQAGGNWDIIRDIIDEVIVARGIEVTVYDLTRSEPNPPHQAALDLSI